MKYYSCSIFKGLRSDWACKRLSKNESENTHFCNIQRLNFQIGPLESARLTLVNTPNNDINRVPLNH